MPSDLPVIKVRTSEENVLKLKVIAKNNNRSVSKEVEELILNHICEYEKSHGDFSTYIMSPKEFAEDISNRIHRKPPYGDNL